MVEQAGQCLLGAGAVLGAGACQRSCLVVPKVTRPNLGQDRESDRADLVLYWRDRHSAIGPFDRAFRVDSGPGDRGREGSGCGL